MFEDESAGCGDVLTYRGLGGVVDLGDGGLFVACVVVEHVLTYTFDAVGGDVIGGGIK